MGFEEKIINDESLKFTSLIYMVLKPLLLKLGFNDCIHFCLYECMSKWNTLGGFLWHCPT